MTNSVLKIPSANCCRL